MNQSEEEWAVGRMSRQLVGRSLFHVYREQIIRDKSPVPIILMHIFPRYSVTITDMCNERMVKAQTFLSENVDFLKRPII